MDRLLGSVRRRAGAALSNGLPATLIAVAALVVGVSILVEANNRDVRMETFAQFKATKDACILDRRRTRGFDRCRVLGPGVYALTTRRALASTTAIVTRGSCCPGAAAASVTGARAVTVVLKRLRGTVHAQILVP